MLNHTHRERDLSQISHAEWQRTIRSIDVALRPLSHATRRNQILELLERLSAGDPGSFQLLWGLLHQVGRQLSFPGQKEAMEHIAHAMNLTGLSFTMPHGREE